MDAARLEEQYNRELEEMTDEIRSGIKSGKYSMADIQKLLGDKTKEAATATDEFVRDNPWAALGIAATVGCVVGYLLSRK
ncbi:MAG: hypothetical protein ABS95_01590 [Verrucomicrobia bacterium SCN 57-15]|nr:MAG: hypothetical protein ABS95_01590 [Verrucomicrobia bacterium SCN 57-15]